MQLRLKSSYILIVLVNFASCHHCSMLIWLFILLAWSDFQLNCMVPSMSTALFIHFLQGPHLRYSKESTSEHKHSLGDGHLDILSAFPCLLPGLCWMEKSKADKISNQILPFGSLRVNSQTSAWWSVRTRNFLPRRYCR